MAAISDYLEKTLLNYIFRNGSFPKPENISLALLNTIPKDNDTGSTMDEVLEYRTNESGAKIFTQYARASLGEPQTSGQSWWSNVGQDTDSAYFVYTETITENVASSGYYYPLYADDGSGAAQQKAIGAGNGSTRVFEFADHPGVTFYKPENVGPNNGSPDNPDPDEIIYRFYDGNGFIQNQKSITFNSAGKGGWGEIVAVAIMDSANYGEGQILMYAPLSIPKTIGEGDVVQFIPSQLEISLK